MRLGLELAEIRFRSNVHLGKCIRSGEVSQIASALQSRNVGLIFSFNIKLNKLVVKGLCER